MMMTMVPAAARGFRMAFTVAKPAAMAVTVLVRRPAGRPARLPFPARRLGTLMVAKPAAMRLETLILILATAGYEA
jgi:hypothetical protein